MKLKLISMLTATLTLVAATPLAVKPAAAAPGKVLLAQSMPQPGQRQLPNLNLTDDQKSQLRQIQEETNQKIEEILTSEQRQKLKAAMPNRRGGMQDNLGGPNSSSNRQGRPNDIFASLNLSDDQKNQIKQIMESSRDKMNSVLTDDQRQQLQQVQQNAPRQFQPVNQ